MENKNIQVQHAEPNVSSAVQEGFQSNFSVPPMDIYEEHDQIKYLLDLPGIKKDSLKVQVDQNHLFVNAYVDSQGENKKILHKERNSGEYHRQIPLNPGTKQETIQADYYNGVLEIKIPKNI